MALLPQQVAPELLSKVTKRLGITTLNQWYYVSHHAAKRAIGKSALNKCGGSVASFLRSAYPNHHFDEEKLTPKKGQERDQKFIEVVIRKLFPNTEIQTKARKSVGIINPETDAYLEIDFWMPSLKLGIEYQDKHHYGYQWYANGTLEDYQKRDSVKKDAMANLGYTLITIGFWWDKTLESVAATIRTVRPDLLTEFEGISASPIPAELPPGYVTEASVIPGVEGIMSPFIPGNNFNPSNWYGGEKHDGIRGVYNPKLHKMFSRSGNEFSVLPSLLDDIPNTLVEGEIIAGRGNYNKTAAISYHTHHDKVNWPMYRYVIYDIPDNELGIYKQRYSAITSGLSDRLHIFTQLAFRVLLDDKEHLKILMDAIICDHGEGVIVQQDARYEYGRAKSLAKIKLRRDADAHVLRVHERSCTCKLVSGATADIGFSDDFDPSTLKVGDVISYYHNGNTPGGKPKQAEIYKIRYDLSWEQLVSSKPNAVRRRSVKEATGSGSLSSSVKIRAIKMGHWNKVKNVREFLDEFARTSGFDPLVPENWYTVRITALKLAGGIGLLKAYRNKFVKMITSAYPELKFELEKFRSPRNKNGYWGKIPNVRVFLDEFARLHGFDPLVSANWFPIKNKTLEQYGGGSLLRLYSLKKALTLAYPEVSFAKVKFRTHDRVKEKNGHWNKQQHVRAFFDNLARMSGFDPLEPQNWYRVKSKALKRARGGGLLKHYTVLSGLKFAYPELKFEVENFRTHNEGRNKLGHWSKAYNVRALFDKFARTAGFDPLLPENWNSVTTRSVKQAGGGGIFEKYSKMQALTLAYPELTFKAENFIHYKVRDKT